MMKSFRQHLSELVTPEGKPAPRKSLIIFDFDDTLAVGTTPIDVVDEKTGALIRSLSSTEFKTYHLKPGEAFDFKKFRREPIQAKPIPRNIKILKDTIARGRRAVILTARGQSAAEKAVKWLEQYGVKGVEAVGVGEDAEREAARQGKGANMHAITAQLKTAWVEKQITSGHNDIKFFDDNIANVRDMKKLKQKGVVRVRSMHSTAAPKGEAPAPKAADANDCGSRRDCGAGAGHKRNNSIADQKPGTAFQTRNRIWRGKRQDGSFKYFADRRRAEAWSRA